MKGWLTEALDRELEPMQRKGQVRLLGFVPDDELNALYSGARAFIYPSLYEGFGLPPLEAMACGAPVITSNKASLPEVVGNAGILVEPLDIEQMNQAIESLLENDSLHHELRQKGLERASLFTWEKTASKTYEVFRRVAGEHVI
jgi:alpha-1,3-rhamnosyl/mannosyltransferase